MPTAITILDAHTATALPAGQSSHSAEPDWAPLETLGHLTIYPRTAPALIVRRVADTPIVLTNKTPLCADTIAALPKLKYIGILATGVNIIDLAAARQRGIVVTNVPGYSSNSVAQHVFALLLELVNHVGAHDRAVHDGRWTASPDFSFTVAPLTELAGKTLGIVGLGDIGRRVATIGHALGMSIAAAHQSSMNQVDLPGIDINWQPIDQLMPLVDVLTLHCPLTDKTHHLISADRLARLKPTACLINTGRGPLIDEPALAAALARGNLAGAALDVLCTEPPAADNPLLTAPRCLITPHIAWATQQARARLIHVAADNIKAYLQGRPTNVVTDVVTDVVPD